MKEDGIKEKTVRGINADSQVIFSPFLSASRRSECEVFSPSCQSAGYLTPIIAQTLFIFLSLGATNIFPLKSLYRVFPWHYQVSLLCTEQAEGHRECLRP